MSFSFIATEVDKLLEDKNITLEKLIEEPDIIQETRAGNINLINFLKTHENIIKLKDISLSDPPELNSLKDFKYSSIASDILSSPVRAIAESVITILPHLFDYLDYDVVHPVTMSFILKILYNCLFYCCDEFIGIVKDNGNFVNLLLKHIHVFAVSGFISDIYSTPSPLLEYFDQTGLSLRLVLCLNDANCGVVTRLLCDFLNGPVDIFTVEYGQSLLIEHSVISRLCEMLTLPNCHNVILVLCSIFDPIYVDDDSLQIPHKYDTFTLLDQLVTNCSYFVALLQFIPDTPLGILRLSLVRLVASTIKHNHGDYINAIERLNVVIIIMDLFFHYPFHSLLHFQVHRLLHTILSNINYYNKLAIQIFTQYGLVSRLMDVFDREYYLFNYSKRLTDYTAQGMDIILFLHQLTKDNTDSPVLLELVNSPTWIKFCEDNLDKYNSDNCKEENDMSEEILCDEEYDSKAYDEFITLSSQPPTLHTLQSTINDSINIDLSLRDPFNDIDKTVKVIQVNDYNVTPFCETRDKKPIVFGQCLDKVHANECDWMDDVWDSFDNNLVRHPTFMFLDDD